MTTTTDGNPNGADLLDEIRRFLQRFIAHPSDEAATAHALWILHAHVVEQFLTTPRLAFLSPEPGSGKSRAMEVTAALTPRAVATVNASTAYIFRKVSDPGGLPTLLIDEADAIFKGRGDGNEDLRGFLNSGYRQGATVGRVEPGGPRGEEMVTRDWPSFSAVALAGLNALPDTLMTRAVVIPMQRRRPDQRVEPWRMRTSGPEAEALHEKIGTYAETIRATIGNRVPALPEAIVDRDADVWEPLLAVADEAGGQWPELARAAAVAFVAASKEREPTAGVKLLSDIRSVLAAGNGADRMASTELVQRLLTLEDSPWWAPEGNGRGEALNPRTLAAMLKGYGITPAPHRIDGRVVKGYRAADFADAWGRYLKPLPVTTEPPTDRREDQPMNTVPPSAPTMPACPVCSYPMAPEAAADGLHPMCHPRAIEERRDQDHRADVARVFHGATTDPRSPWPSSHQPVYPVPDGWQAEPEMNPSVVNPWAAGA